MAGVWIHVKWPEVNRLRATGDVPRMRRMLWPRVWLQALSFISFATAVILIGPWMLDILNTDKDLLPGFWLSLLALNCFLELQFSFWGVLLSTENRIPFLWPAVATNLATLLVAMALIQMTMLGLPSLVLAPLVTGSLFNYWYWPPTGARSIGTTLNAFLFRRRWETS
jgi:hypothetical protein